LLSTAKAKNAIKAEVSKATYVGSHMEYTVLTDVGNFFATSEDVDAVLKPGDKVSLTFAGNAPVLLPSDNIRH
jgi:hypothetical protein